jgi:hypothetical protein
MKKSEIYKYAQCAVIDAHLTNETKLAILRELILQEDVWKNMDRKEDKAE